MSRDDWYRNTDWNEAISEAFETKLRRARDKSQRLRIQARYLIASHPQVALELLHRYFETGDHFDFAQACVDRAEALLQLGQLEDALASYEAALAREAAFPNTLTQAGLDYPLLVAERGLSDYYGRALEVLANRTARTEFPIERFRWHAAYALIFDAQGNSEAASTHAVSALEVAGETDSGFRYHRKLGLVGDSERALVSRLAPLASDKRR